MKYRIGPERLGLNDFEYELVSRSKYSNRMLYLIGRQELDPSFPGELLTIYPTSTRSNCWGTVIYLLDAKALMIDQIEKLRVAGRYPCTEIGDRVYFPGEDRPGFVGFKPMELFLAENDKIIEVEEREIDCVVSLFCHLNLRFVDPIFNPDISAFIAEFNEQGHTFLAHSGLHLGNISGTDYLFHQNDMGGKFEVAPIRKYVDENLEGRGVTERYYRFVL